MGCSHTIIPASEGHLFACPGSRIGSRVRWIRAKTTDQRKGASRHATIGDAQQHLIGLLHEETKGDT